MPVKASKLKELRKEIPYHYKPQSVKFGKAIIVGYIDNRDVQDLLDEVVGPENWSVDFHTIKDQMFARVGIYVDFEDTTPPQWIYKCDTGTEANMEEEKSQVSDSMKRASVHWGIGRFLYRLGVIELPSKEYNGKERVATKDGKILWTNDEISEYIRSLKEGSEKIAEAISRYETPKVEPVYNKNTYSQEVINRVARLERNGLKGKECLKSFIEQFNKVKKTTFIKISDFSDDTKLNALIDFIEAIPPAKI